MRGTYVNNTRILIYLITANGVSKMRLNHASSASLADKTATDYRVWTTTVATVYKPNMWFANFTSAMRLADAQDKGKVSANPHENQPPCPTKNTGMDSRRTFITHRVSDSPGSKPWELGCLDKFDGSAIVRAKGQIRVRAIGGTGWKYQLPLLNRRAGRANNRFLMTARA